MNRHIIFAILFLESLISIISFDSCAKHVEFNENDLLANDSHYIIVFGDIQLYTYGSLIEYYKASLEWIKTQIDNNVDICAVLVLGDVTQNNKESQWVSFQEATQFIANRVPIFVCTGNHDYTWKASKITDRESTLINQYAHFLKTDESIIDYYQGTNLENYIAQINIGNDKLNLLVLEFGARPIVLDWASDYVKSHPNERFLLMTHEWLSSEGSRMNEGTTAELQFAGYSLYSTPEDIWEKLVKDNDNIFSVLCGHEDNFSCLYSSVNSSGRVVPQIMFNLQFLPNGGNGIIQVWKISDYEKSFSVFAYDTINLCCYLPDSTLFFVPYRY